tara:strand:+ start:20410 stop:21075 length:666 start_codon:yes stop_codon:yes gene_type:complete
MRPGGLFITVEGTEGVGKSTNIACLAHELRERGIDLVVTREPGGTAIGEGIRDILLRVGDAPMCAETELLLIFAARAQHLNEVIKPALDAGQWVVSDRFTDATYAYQGGGRGLDNGMIQLLEDLVQAELRPDFTLLLDVDVKVGLSRAHQRGELDRIEQETLMFFERVRERYLELAETSSGRYRVIDAGQPLDSIRQKLQLLSDELLACWEVRRQSGDDLS